jgi:hypothetical protein
MSNQIVDGDNSNYVQYWMNEIYQTTGQLNLDIETKYRINITTVDPPPTFTLFQGPVFPANSTGWIEVRLSGAALLSGYDAFIELVFYTITNGVFLFNGSPQILQYVSTANPGSGVVLLAVGGTFIVQLQGGSPIVDDWKGYCKITNVGP